MKTKILATLASLVFLAAATPAQLFGQKEKAKKVKEKRFEQVVKGSLKDYEGTYTGIDPTYVIEVRVRADGNLKMSSLEDNQKVTIENIGLEGAHLTATKIYMDGHTERFDGTFVNRILNGVSAFGILVDGMNLKIEGLSLSRVFYRRTNP